MLRTAAKVFGAVLLLVGVLGFIPVFAPESADGHRALLGIFEVDTVHNIVHILTGVLGLAAASSVAGARRYFQVFGLVYALVTVVGLIQGDTVLGLFHTNGADHVLHLAITALALYLGFGAKDDARTAV